MYTGRCLCGGVTFTVEDADARVNACHCGMCRRWCGGPFFAVRSRGVRFAGEDAVGRFASSDWAERGFCTRCGSALFYYLKPSGTHMLSLGVFDDPTPFRLAREIFIDRKPGCYALAGEHPRWTEAETFARLAPK
jgi:hypothetical protein